MSRPHRHPRLDPSRLAEGLEELGEDQNIDQLIYFFSDARRGTDPDLITSLIGHQAVDELFEFGIELIQSGIGWQERIKATETEIQVLVEHEFDRVAEEADQLNPEDQAAVLEGRVQPALTTSRLNRCLRLFCTPFNGHHLGRDWSGNIANQDPIWRSLFVSANFNVKSLTFKLFFLPPERTSVSGTFALGGHFEGFMPVAPIRADSIEIGGKIAGVGSWKKSEPNRSVLTGGTFFLNPEDTTGVDANFYGQSDDTGGCLRASGRT